jgi:hypothetical protein
MMPTASEEKRMWLRKIVGDVLDKIVPDSTKHIIFCSLGNRNKRDIPLVEVKLDSRDLALKIRKEFSKKKKSENDFGRIFIANSVTLATRVRVDILKVIAKKTLYRQGEALRVCFRVEASNPQQVRGWAN